MSFLTSSPVERGLSNQSNQSPASMLNYTPASLQDYTPASAQNFTLAPAISAADSYEEAGCDSRYQTCAAVAATATLLGTAATLFGTVSGDGGAAAREIETARRLVRSGSLEEAATLFREYTPSVVDHLLREGKDAEARALYIEDAMLQVRLGLAIAEGNITSGRSAGEQFAYAGERMVSIMGGGKGLWRGEDYDAKMRLFDRGREVLKRAISAYVGDEGIERSERFTKAARIARSLADTAGLPQTEIGWLTQAADFSKEAGDYPAEAEAIGEAARVQAVHNQFNDAAVSYERAYAAMSSERDDRRLRYDWRAAEMWYKAKEIDAALTMARFAAAGRGIDPDMPVLRVAGDRTLKEVKLLSILAEVYRARLGLRKECPAEEMDQKGRAEALWQLTHYYERLLVDYNIESSRPGTTSADHSDYLVEMGLIDGKTAQAYRELGRYQESARKFENAGMALRSPELLVNAAEDYGRLKDRASEARLLAEAANITIRDHAGRAELYGQAVSTFLGGEVSDDMATIMVDGRPMTLATLLRRRIVALLEAWREKSMVLTMNERPDDATLKGHLSAGSRGAAVRLLMRISVAFDALPPGGLSHEEEAQRDAVNTTLLYLTNSAEPAADSESRDIELKEIRKANIRRLAEEVGFGEKGVAAQELIRAAGRWLEDEIGRRPPEDIIKRAFMGRGFADVVAAVGRLFEGRPDIAFGVRTAFEVERGAEGLGSEAARLERRSALERALEAARRPLEMAAKK